MSPGAYELTLGGSCAPGATNYNILPRCSYWVVVHVCQSHVEIEYYSVVYFDRVTAFKRHISELPLWAGLKRAV